MLTYCLGYSRLSFIDIFKTCIVFYQIVLQIIFKHFILLASAIDPFPLTNTRFYIHVHVFVFLIIYKFLYSYICDYCSVEYFCLCFLASQIFTKLILSLKFLHFLLKYFFRNLLCKSFYT